MREGTPKKELNLLLLDASVPHLSIYPNPPQPPRAIGTSVTSGNFRDFWKNDDDDEKRFLFLYLRV